MVPKIPIFIPKIFVVIVYERLGTNKKILYLPSIEHCNLIVLAFPREVVPKFNFLDCTFQQHSNCLVKIGRDLEETFWNHHFWHALRGTLTFVTVTNKGFPAVPIGV